MKKIFRTILAIILFTSCVYPQWSPRQSLVIDSLWQAIDSLGTSSLPPLPQGYFWIGNAEGYPSARVMGGDGTMDYLGNLTIGTAKISDSKLNTGINATKIGSGNISNTEFSYLDGATGNLQSQINSFATGTGFIAKDLATKQTSTSEIYFSEDGIRYVNSASSFSSNNVKAGIPIFSSDRNLANLYPGDIYLLSGQMVDDINVYPLKAVHLNGDLNKVLVTYWDATQTQIAINAIAIFEEASLSNASTDTLDFRNTKIVTDWFGANTAQTVYVVNYQPKTVSCFVQSDEGVTFNFGGKTVKYADGIHLPTFTDQKIYLITMIYSGNIVWVSYVEYKD